MDELSSTLELAQALESQLERVHETVSRESIQGDPGDGPRAANPSTVP